MNWTQIGTAIGTTAALCIPLCIWIVYIYFKKSLEKDAEHKYDKILEIFKQENRISLEKLKGEAKHEYDKELTDYKAKIDSRIQRASHVTVKISNVLEESFKKLLAWKSAFDFYTLMTAKSNREANMYLQNDKKNEFLDYFNQNELHIYDDTKTEIEKFSRLMIHANILFQVAVFKSENNDRLIDMTSFDEFFKERQKVEPEFKKLKKHIKSVLGVNMSID